MVLMDFVTHSHALPVEFSDFVQNPLVNSHLWRFKKLKHRLDLFTTTDNSTPYF